MNDSGGLASQPPTRGRTLRVLHVAPAAVIRANRALDQALATDCGHDVTLVVPRSYAVRNGVVVAEAAASGTSYRLVLLDRTRAHARAATWHGLGDLVRKVQPEIILSDQDPATAEGLQLKMATRSQRVPIVFCNVENVDRDYLDEARHALRRLRVARAALSAAVGVFVRLAYAWRDIGMWSMNLGGLEIVKHRRMFRGPVVHAPLGIDAAVFRPDRNQSQRQELGLVDPTFGQFGRLTPEKGILHLLEAASRLRHRYRFQILIDSMREHDSAVFAQQVSASAGAFGLADRVVRFTAAHEEMPRYYNSIDCLVAPSYPSQKYTEQYGRVVAEAMGCGVPVVVSDCGHLPDLVGPFGEVFPAGDVARLADCLGRFLSDPGAYRGRAELAHQYFLERLSSTAQAAVLTALFMELLDRRRAA